MAELIFVYEVSVYGDSSSVAVTNSHFFTGFFFLVTLFRVGVFIRSRRDLVVAQFSPIWNLGSHCWTSVRIQCLCMFLSLGWITGGHAIQPPIKILLPPTGFEPTLFRNSAS